MAQLGALMQKNFIEYASYVVTDRAIPDLRDGLKPVQRRILHTLREMHDGRFHKVANVIGETMKLHPHGDAAIGDALVVVANKGYFIERQGNFGSLLTGHPAAAPRYIECRLTPLALETLFNAAVTQFVPSYDGRKQEPIALPAKLPVLLLQGTEGIAVGMATRILPHNFCELLQAEIDLLRGKEPRVYPDFAQGGEVDVSEYADGRGKVTVRAKIRAVGDKKVVISELPYSTTTESVIQSIEQASAKGKIKIGRLNDYTTDRVEIEIALSRGTYAKEVIPQLYAYTDCEVSISSNIVAIHERRPVDLTVTQVLASQTDQLLESLKVELEYDLSQLRDKQHWLTLEQLFIEKRVYKRIEEAKTKEAVFREVWDGMHEYEASFVRPMVDDDVERLLQVRIRRISAYDIDKNRADIKEVARDITECQKKLGNLIRTATRYLKDLLEKYGPQYPRRTVLTAFRSVDRREVARQDIKLSYDRKSGFFGSKVKGDQFQLSVSEFDRILAISRDGSFRIVGPAEKKLMPKLLHCAPFDTTKGATFSMVYRDRNKVAYAKKFKITSFIKEKEYALIADGGRVDLLVPGETPGKVHLQFVPAARQKVSEATVDLDPLAVKGTTARGNRLSPKAVGKVTRVKG